MENTSLDFLFYTDSVTDPLIYNGLTIKQMIKILNYVSLVFSEPDSLYEAEINSAHILFIDEHVAIYERTGYYHRQTWVEVIYPYLRSCLFHYLMKSTNSSL